MIEVELTKEQVYDITASWKKFSRDWFVLLARVDDAKKLDKQVYDQEDVAAAAFILIHTAINYSTGEMLKQGCSPQFTVKKTQEMIQALVERCEEHLKIHIEY